MVCAKPASSWFKALQDFLRSLGLTQSLTEPCVFNGPGIILIIYVDDGIIFAKNKSDAEALFNNIKGRFPAKGIGDPKHLGNTIERQADGSILLHQRGFAELMGNTPAAIMAICPSSSSACAADARCFCLQGTQDGHQGQCGDLNSRICSKAYRAASGFSAVWRC